MEIFFVYFHQDIEKKLSSWLEWIIGMFFPMEVFIFLTGSENCFDPVQCNLD